MFYADTVGLPTVLARVKEYRERMGDYWRRGAAGSSPQKAAAFLVKRCLAGSSVPPESLTIEDLPSPRPGPGSRGLGRAASLNFPDVLVIQNKCSSAAAAIHPRQRAGRVKELGAGVTSVRPAIA